MKPKLSLIICSRNRATQLKRCLESIDTKEMLKVNGELILVNNNSKDSTEEVMLSFKKSALSPVIVVNEPNTGLVYARNAGLLKSKGEVIVFTDDDCYLTKGYLTKASKVFDPGDFDYCGGQIWLYDKTDVARTCNYIKEKHIIRPYSWIPIGTIQGTNMVFHRRVIDKIGLFDIMFGPGTPFICDDVDYVARASWAGFTGAHIPELVVYHHHGRKPGKDFEKVWEGYMAGKCAYYTKFILQGKFVYLRYWLISWRYIGKEFERVWKGYMVGKRAYYTKFILQGKFVYLRYWLISWRYIIMSWCYIIWYYSKYFGREIKSGLKYLFARIKNIIKA